MMLFDQTFKIKLKSNNDNRGYFIEIFKLNQINFKSKIHQVSHSLIKKKNTKRLALPQKTKSMKLLAKGKN